ncbi:hypothetical protein ACHAWF_003245 [Thalassiosira exigua]
MTALVDDITGSAANIATHQVQKRMCSTRTYFSILISASLCTQWCFIISKTSLTPTSTTSNTKVLLSPALDLKERRLPEQTSQSKVKSTESITSTLDGDYTWSRYCKSSKLSPCIAILSAAHHGGVASTIDQKTLSVRNSQNVQFAEAATNSLQQRILLREAYCAIHSCDIIIDYNNYHKHRTMWLSDHGKHKRGGMPPHWNKVAAIQRWLPHFDGVLLMDMDTVWVDFNTSVYDLFNATTTIYSNGDPELVMFKRGEMSRCIVDKWWYHGTGPGCRYVKFPMNYRSQTPNLDMPWFWFSLMKCAEIYGGREPFECLNPCNGPEKYQRFVASGTAEDEELNKIWIRGCMKEHQKEITDITKAVTSGWLYSKRLIHEANWGKKIFGKTIEDMSECSIAVHCKDRREMLHWMNKTVVEVLLHNGCTQQSCAGADRAAMFDRMRNWSSTLRRDDFRCIEKYYGAA